MSKNKEANIQKWYVAGLGNPGKRYEHTRHNVGLDAVTSFNTNTDTDTLQLCNIIDTDTYMNLSGGPVAKALGNSKQERIDSAKTLIVVHDDLDLPFGEVKISVGSGSGGQKGVEDIIKALGTKDFVRVRIGIVPVFLGKMRKPPHQTVERFVLKQFGITERHKLPEILSRASDAISEVIINGTQSAMNKFN